MSDLNKSSVLLLMRLSKPGNRRKVPTGSVEVDADKECISVSKELLTSKELTAIGTLDGQIRQWIYTRSLPSSVLKEGVYRLPLSLVDETDAALKQFHCDRLKLIEQFLYVYPSKAEEARERLRSLYDPKDYPPAGQLRDAFDMQWRYLTLDIPETISNLLIEEQRAKAQQDLAAEVEEIRVALRQSFADLIAHAAASLDMSNDGKPKIFRDSLVSNMSTFFNYFDARNLTDDKQLSDLVQRARDAMQGVTPDSLRQDMDLRSIVQKTMTEVKQVMDANVMAKPSRRFSLAPQN
ncbi:MAG: hypothetical protein WC364_10255 [Eubacteriales bacterium]